VGADSGGELHGALPRRAGCGVAAWAGSASVRQDPSDRPNLVLIIGYDVPHFNGFGYVSAQVWAQPRWIAATSRMWRMACCAFQFQIVWAGP
jgi:hypothetical protein